MQAAAFRGTGTRTDLRTALRDVSLHPRRKEAGGGREHGAKEKGARRRARSGTHTHTHTHTHTRTHAHTYAHTRTHAHAYTRTRVHTQLFRPLSTTHARIRTEPKTAQMASPPGCQLGGKDRHGHRHNTCTPASLKCCRTQTSRPEICSRHPRHSSFAASWRQQGGCPSIAARGKTCAV